MKPKSLRIFDATSANQIERRVSEKTVQIVIETSVGKVTTFDFTEAARLIEAEDVLGVEMIEVKPSNDF